MALNRFVLALVALLAAGGCAKPPYAIRSQQLSGPVERINSARLQFSLGDTRSPTLSESLGSAGRDISQFNAVLRSTFESKMRSLLTASSVRVDTVGGAQPDMRIAVTTSQVDLNIPGSFVGKFKVSVHKEPHNLLLWEGEFLESSLASASSHRDVGEHLAIGIVTRLRELGFLGL